MTGYLALILMVLLTTASQIFIKLGASKIQIGNNLKHTLKTAFNIYMISGGICTALAGVVYIFALTKVPLNIAYSFTGFNYILVFFASYTILKEKINEMQCVGVTMIFLGILVWHI